ncbi:YdaS family helix-turn-helix protein [Candidatus Accumulibacter vicinus]|nr:YdaS family helix-turn-helix protein [Candidatus Accumulibacter vicinus]
MDISTWLDADRGRLTALAAHFGLTQSAVSQWRANGVPPARMKAVREFTGGAVTLDDMLPAWPQPDGREGSTVTT